MKNKKPDAALLWKQLEENLVPRLRLNLPERVVYAHLLRLSRLAGRAQLRFSMRQLACTAHVSRASAVQAVRRLIAKGALRLIERSPAGHVVEVRLPDEIRAIAGESVATDPARRSRTAGPASLEQMNFLQGKARQEAIHARDRGLCFYCLSKLTPSARCLDHVLPAARGGTNSYRNLVSCCVECNAQKGQTAAEDYLRSLSRQRRLTAGELADGLRRLDALAAGELRPVLGPPATVSHVVGAGLAPPVPCPRSQRILGTGKPGPSCQSSPAPGRAGRLKPKTHALKNRRDGLPGIALDLDSSISRVE